MWSTGTSYWWGYSGVRCDSNLGSVWYGLVYRLSAQGDTLRAMLPVPFMSEYITTNVLVSGSRLAIAGRGKTSTSPPTEAPFCLTLADTSGNLLSHHTYPRTPLAYDYPIDLVRTPRKGYLLSGDGTTSPGAQHLLLETDSLGRQLKQRLIFPLGPDFNDGRRVDHHSNIVVLPNAGGYVVSGNADSLGTGVPRTRRSVCYLMRLDTALTVQWVYRHPTATNGNGVRSQYPNKVRLLPDGSLGLLVRNAQALGISPNLYLVQVDALTGQHRATYPLPSSGGYGVTPYDWHWLDDNTLLLAGESQQAGSTGGSSAYLARWDFRATPLATAHPAVTKPLHLIALPNPASETVRLELSDAAPADSHLELLELATGRVVLTARLPLHERAMQLDVHTLASGVYAARLLTGSQQRAITKLVIVR